MTNQTALDGANIDFYRKVADGLRAIIACAHEPVRIAEINVNRHRLGGELSFELGPTSMYQSLLEITTVGGESFKELIDASLSTDAETTFLSRQPMIATLVTVRATGHHEHHASAESMIRNNPGGESNHHHPVGGHFHRQGE